VTLASHAVAPRPERLTRASPLVFDRASQSFYIGYSLGRGRHDEVYNLIQRRGSLTAHLAEEAHGYYLPDGTFEWYEYFSVPNALEEEELRVVIEGRPVEVSGPRRLALRLRRRLRPLRAQAKRAAAIALEVERRARPPRPPVAPPERVDEMSRVEPGGRFISGNGYASRCRHVLNHDVLSVDKGIDNDWWFCKSDWLEYFFRELAPESPFVLFTANSDRPIDRTLSRHLRRPSLVAWFGVNAALEHPKLFAVPLGIGDPSTPQDRPGDELRSAQAADLPKSRLFHVSFDVKTNPAERLHCLAETGLELAAPAAAPEYLRRLASAYFCIAPRGNGIDTHRVWESLYLRTIPVVTRSVLTDQHPDLPLVVLDDWSEFGSVEFSPELYDRIWSSWRPSELSLDGYLRRVSRTLEELREPASGQPEEAREA
jgi:hypothetical protein